MNARKKTEPVLVRAVLTSDPGTVEASLRQGAPVNESDRDGRTALHHAVIEGALPIVRILIESGADLDARDAQGWAPLHFAAADAKEAIGEELLKAGASVDAEDTFGNTPLFRAVFDSKGRPEMIRLLRRFGADSGHQNRHGVSPASLAASIANYDLAGLLD